MAVLGLYDGERTEALNQPAPTSDFLPDIKKGRVSPAFLNQTKKLVRFGLN